MIELECSITNTIYTNPENGYAVIIAKDKDNGKSFTLVFPNGMVDPKVGYNLIVNGDWVISAKWGKQFVAKQYQEIAPTEIDGIIAYLSCGIFKGIGEKFARKIVEHFGSETVSIIENSPEKLYEVKGMGNKKVESIIAGWVEHKHLQEIVSFFGKYGLTTTMIMKIFKHYGNDAIFKIKENPYRLASEIDGIGFRRADDVAMKLGTDKYDFNRQASCINYVLSEEGEDGHTFLYRDSLIKKCEEYLEIESNVIDETITDLLAEDELKTVHGDDIFSVLLYYAEKNIASKLSRLSNFKPFVSSVFPITIEDIEQTIGITYNDKQREAIETCKNHNLMVLTGGPGTGKTTVLLGIIHMLKSMNLSIACAAPTGRAAKRMSEVTNMPAKTIHRLLEYNPMSGYQKNEENPLYYDVIILDEVSMVNVPLMNSLLKAVKPSTRVIFVGDENQLPCIGAGNILHDIIESETIPVIMLKEIFRQAEGSKIIINAHNIINDKPIIINNSDPLTDFFFINETDPDKVETLINDLVTLRLPNKYNVKPFEIQVLSPRRKDVKCCTNELNKILQGTINKSNEQLQYGDTLFKLGDKVMQIKNNYDKGAFNGDVGFITMIDNENRMLSVKFDDDFVVTYDSTDLDELVLAYACTIHKSQGSEYPIVIIPILPFFSIMLKRNLIYTGITRAKDICIIIGDRKSLYRAINDNTYSKRNTMLEEWLRNMIHKEEI